MEQFILHGGLFVMAEMIGDSNLYVRGQALEIVLSIIDCEIYDWFKPIQPGDYVQANLHKKLLALVNESQLLKNLIANRVGSYPGGSCRALQILAFWLSWLRAVHTEDQKLHLSALVLSELKLWSTTPAADAAAEEEARLARTIYEDFGFQQYGRSVEESESAGAGSSSSADYSFSVVGLSNLPVSDVRRQGRVNEDVSSSSAASSTVVVEEVPVVVSLEQRCAELKAGGNALFKDNKLTEAIEQYKLALSILSEDSTKISSNSSSIALQVDLFTNCATCWWKMQSDEAGATKVELLTRCAEECRSALALSAHYPKAVYRLATVLLEENRPEEALPLLLQALQHHRDLRLSGKATGNVSASAATNSEGVDDITASSSSSVDSNIDLLTNLRVRCIAALLMKNSNEVGGLSHTDLGMSAKGAQLLQSILQRNQNDAAVDWQVVRPTTVPATAAATAAGDEGGVPAADAGKAVAAEVDEVDQLLNRRTADTSKWILEDLLNKNRIAAESHNTSVSSASFLSAKENKLAAVNSSSTGTTSKDGKKKSSATSRGSEGKPKKSGAADASSKTYAAFNDFKKLAKQCDQKFGSEAAVPENKRNELNQLLDTAGKVGMHLLGVIIVLFFYCTEH